MKKLFLFICLTIISLYNTALCNNEISLNEKIKIIETETNTYSEQNLNIEQRLKNIEFYVFGNEKSGDLNQRADNLINILGLSELISPTENPITKQENKTDTLSSTFEVEMDEPKPRKKEFQNYNYYSPKTSDIKLSTLEKNFLGKTYDNENYSKRLSRIENKIFSRTFDNENDETRLERISAIEKAQKTNKEYKVNKFAKFASTGIQIGGILLLLLAMIL